MSDEQMNAEPDERTPEGARLAPSWKWNFKPNVTEMKAFLNTPSPLPQGAVSVTAVSNGFHIVFFE